MSSLVPDFRFEDILHITPEFLKARNVQALTLDLDNTLAPYKQRGVKPAIAAWLASMREHGIQLAVLSNAREKRVAEFCAPLGLPYISEAQKPGASCFRRVAALLKLPPRKIGMVGDQLFTDIQGAKRNGFLAIWVKPLSLNNPLYRLRSWLESPFLARAPHG